MESFVDLGDMGDLVSSLKAGDDTAASTDSKDRVREAFLTRLADEGATTIGFELRTPAHTRLIAARYSPKVGDSDAANMWHQDTCWGKSFHILCWSNCYSSQLKKFDESRIATPPDNHLTLWNNEELLHRINPMSRSAPKSRWFARMLVVWDL